MSEVSVGEVAALLRERGPALVLTGAGISTESGIPDYRGPDGNRRVTPMSHQEFTATSAARQRYWARSFIGWQRFTAAEPNAGHFAVAALQRAGAFGPIITQNVDGLHQSAGATDVIELHGNLAEVVCLTCEERVDRDLVQAYMHDANPEFASLALGLVGDGSRVSSQIRPDGDIVLDDEAVQSFIAPRCLVCREDTLKPDVVFFGGSVPKPRVEQCFALTDAAPVLVVLGSSLKVMSGYRFVRRAAAHGIPVVVVTKGPTRAEAETTHRIDAPLGVTLSALAEVTLPRVMAGSD
ncbi:Sir2 family NAD-dependent protein deacetylase [Knoellia sp. Soil729]|uniref:Sir2 family NAD-dependent protein deacetylase n=1 Tax=Knoellia sp. Soil729 TaxID=1736394 RepID=UPI0006F902BC|nr:Sir2 family NAD-dependent protein deacetylase [Knoellia sp. Soil729]KRE41156.1 NAD-dependent protein deacetylase 1 [Knoellia sp. Soil729]